MQPLIRNPMRIVWKAIPPLFLACLSMPLARAATYYVATNGVDSNPGTPAAPLRTIQRAASASGAGDTVYVNEGLYEEVVDLAKAGAPERRIQYIGHNAKVYGFNIRQPYNTVDGFDVNGKTLPGTIGAVYIYEAADATHILNCTIHDLTNKYGIQFAMPKSPVPTNGQLNCIISNCVLQNVRYVNVCLYGNGHTVCNSTISNTGGEGDAIRPWGANHLIADNVMSNISGTGGGHADILQVFSYNGEYCQNVTFERNRVYGDSAQICQLEMCAGGYAYTNDGRMTNLVIRNNLFLNMQYAANVDMDGTKWYNNLFYRCNRANGGHVFAIGGEKGSGWGTEFKNNIFYECGNGSSSKGWYPVVGGVQGITNFNIMADHNFICGSNFIAMAEAPPDSNYRWKSQGQESHGINGGDPRFVSAFEMDFRLRPDSPLIDAGSRIASFGDDLAGTGRGFGKGWDIGPYEFQHAACETSVSSGRVVSAWNTISGVVYQLQVASDLVSGEWNGGEITAAGSNEVTHVLGLEMTNEVGFFRMLQL
jgi:hypothetical protein